MTLRKRTLALLIAAALTPQFAATAYAQAPTYAPAHAPARAAYTQAELDQMLAPIALYPDPLLSQILMAATYPIEVVEAARWTRANPGLRGDAAVRAVHYQDWDPSVKSLCAFPLILQRMDEHLQWTEDLGEAFLAQEAEVMDSVQQLRQRAYAAGHLRSTAQIHVIHDGPHYYVRPVRPEVFYVPYYDPLVVYGDWRWPAYRPVVWAPWPGYVRPGVAVGFWFGSPVSLSANFFFGDFDWGRRSVRVVRPTAYYYRPPRVIVNNTTIINRNVTVDRSRWQHDPHHRRGADYRRVEVRERFANAQTERRAEQREPRREERGVERRAEQREAQRPEQRQVQAPRPQQQAQPQARPEQTRPERREAREERPRRDAQSAERSQQQQREQAQAAERAQRDQQQAAERAQRQQRDQAQAAERTQRDQQRQQAEAARAQQREAQQQQRQQAEAARAQQQQQRQQAEAARAQQREAQQQQRQQAEAARAQQREAQQQQRQQAEAARAQQRQQAEASRAQQQQQRQAREERRGQREDRKDERSERGGGKGGERS